MHCVDNQDSHAKKGVNGQCVQLLCLPTWKGDNCTYMHVWQFCHDQWCECVHGLAVVEALWRPTWIYIYTLELVCEACNVWLLS